MHTLAGTLTSLQNDADGLRLLRAKSACYDASRRVWWVQAILSVAVPAVLGLLQGAVPRLAAYAAAYGLLIAMLDFVLDALKEAATANGARVQELFDARLFGLTWEPNRGTAPGADDVERWSRRHPSTTWLRDWYPAPADELPMWAQHLLCLAVNGGWDSAMRRRYANALLSTLLLAVALVVFTATATNASFSTVLMAMATVLPTVTWAAKDWQRQRKLADGRASVRLGADAAWSAAMAEVSEGRAAEATARRAAAYLQHDVFMLRRDGAPVLSQFYSRWREEDERAMQALAEQRVNEYRLALAAAQAHRGRELPAGEGGEPGPLGASRAQGPGAGRDAADEPIGSNWWQVRQP